MNRFESIDLLLTAAYSQPQVSIDCRPGSWPWECERSMFFWSGWLSLLFAGHNIPTLVPRSDQSQSAAAAPAQSSFIVSTSAVRTGLSGSLCRPRRPVSCLVPWPLEPRYLLSVWVCCERFEP